MGKEHITTKAALEACFEESRKKEDIIREMKARLKQSSGESLQLSKPFEYVLYGFVVAYLVGIVCVIAKL